MHSDRDQCCHTGRLKRGGVGMGGGVWRCEGREVLQKEWYKDTLGGERYAHYLDCGDDLTSVTCAKT